MVVTTVCVFVFASRAQTGEPLRLEAQVENVWVQVLGIKDKHLAGIGASGEVAIPDSAPMRLVGDLRDALDAIEAATSFEIAPPSPAETALQPDLRKARHIELLEARAAGSQWSLSSPEKAVFLCVWQVDGKPVHLSPRPILRTEKGGYHFPRANFTLGPGDTRGNPVFLLLENGRFSPVRSQWSTPEAGRLLARAALGDDEGCAAGIAQLPTVDAKYSDTDFTLLHALAQAGAARSVQALLAHGADPQAEAKGKNTPLHLATRSGRLETVRRLVAATAPLAAKNNYDSTALHIATAFDQPEICRALAEAGAPVNATNIYGETPTLLAAIAGSAPTVEMLLAKKGKFNFGPGGAEHLLTLQAGLGRRELVRILLAQRPRVNDDETGQTPLLAASREGHLGIVEDLLAAKADPNKATADGVVPLHVAAGRAHPAVVARLLAAGAKVDAATDKGNTPLQAACYAGSAESVKALLAAGAQVDRANQLGARPLTYALAAGSREATELILAAGARIDPTAEFFEADLGSALAIDCAVFVTAALQAGMPADFRNQRGWSALQVATLNEAKECATVLRASGATEADTAEANRVVPANQLDRRPAVVQIQSPIDPRDLAELDQGEATVVVQALVDADGSTAFAKAQCKDCRLSQSAVATVLRSKFAPAMKNGVPVATMVRIPIHFEDRSDPVFEFAKLDVKPRPLKQVPPIYPSALKRNGVNGVAVIEFFVDDTGVVRDPVVVGANHPLFAQSSVQALLKWKFSPGQKGGRKVATRMRQTFPFRISH